MEALEASDYVLVRFEAKKKVFHYVGKVEKCAEDNTYIIEYFRNKHINDGNSYAFTKPNNPDIYETLIEDIVRKLPKPSFIKDKLVFPAHMFTDLNAPVR